MRFRRCTFPTLLLAAMAFAWAMPSIADPPTAGDAIVWEYDDCSLLHVDPTTGSSHVISQWGCGGPTVGIGPIDWQPFIEYSDLSVHPNGWVYFIGSDLAGIDMKLYRVHPATGAREFVTDLIDSAQRIAIWPESSFFTPTVAALSAGAVALLVGLLAGTSLRRGKQRTR